MRTFVFTLVTLFSVASIAQTLDAHYINDFGCYGEKKLNRAPKKIYISSFKVFYQVYISDEHKHNKHHSAPPEFEATLIGVDTNDFQLITDQLYKHFTDSLLSRGYELIPFDSVKTAKYFDGWDIHTGGEITKSHIEGYLLSRPNGYTHFEHKAFDHISFVDELPKLSGQLKDAIVIDVEFVFPFVHTNTSKTGYDGHHISDAHVQFNMTPTIGGHDAKATAHTKVHIAYGNPAGVAAKTNMLYTLRYPVKIEGVLTSDKLGPIEKNEVKPGYYPLVFTNGEELKITNHVVVDEQKYTKEAINKGKEFSRYALHKFFYFKELD